MPVFRMHIFHNIKRDGVRHIGRVEINHILYALFWNMIKQFLHGFPVRINKPDSVSSFNILRGHVFEHFRFPHSRLSDHVKVAAAVIKLNTKSSLNISEICFAKKRNRFHFLYELRMVTNIRTMQMYQATQNKYYSIGSSGGAPPFLDSTRGRDDVGAVNLPGKRSKDANSSVFKRNLPGPGF